MIKNLRKLLRNKKVGETCHHKSTTQENVTQLVFPRKKNVFD